MAICLHKLVNRVSVINSIVLQNRLYTTPTLVVAEHIESKNILKTVSNSKPSLLSAEAQTLAQNIRNFLNTTQLNNAANINNQSPPTNGGASEEQLSNIYNKLREDLPRLFVRPLDYSDVHKDVIFENRIHGKTYKGIAEYVKQISLLRLWGHFYYAYVKLDIIKMTKHTEDSTIKVRWRISGITGYRILFKMMQFRVWNPKKMIEEHQRVWLDGFSTFYVDSDGKIIKHVADKMMPDEDKELNPIEKVVNKLDQLPKVALFVKLSADIAPTAI